MTESPPPKDQPLLLVAEDDPATAMVVGDFARAFGWTVQHAADGIAAWSAFQDQPPDLVLLDYYMPGIDGFEVLRRIRESGSQIPVVMMTAAAEEDLVLRALREGATDFLRKPFEDLLVLQSILTRQSQRHRAQSVRKAAASRIISQSIELELENDLAVASAACGHLVEALVPARWAYAVRLGLEELVANAIEHGNLGLTRQQKTEALRGDSGAWRLLLDERRRDPRLAARRVRIIAIVEGGLFEATIRDEGSGFDHRAPHDPLSEENLLLPNGRGVFLARQQFDEIHYQGAGNTVVVRKRFDDD